MIRAPALNTLGPGLKSQCLSLLCGRGKMGHLCLTSTYTAHAFYVPVTEYFARVQCLSSCDNLWVGTGVIPALKEETGERIK